MNRAQQIRSTVIPNRICNNTFYLTVIFERSIIKAKRKMPFEREKRLCHLQLRPETVRSRSSEFEQNDLSMVRVVDRFTNMVNVQ